MKKTLICLLLVAAIHNLLNAQQVPVIYSFIHGTGANGTTQGVNNGIPSNVQSVKYSNTDVYVSCTSVPDYDIGPWNNNPNTPSNQNFVFKITRSPAEKALPKTTTGLGQIGVWSNGVAIFNQKDGMYWNGSGWSMGQGTNWNRNALYYEGISFDNCLGHPAPSGCYHNHVNPTCLYNDSDSLHHSPIIGYAFDGFPIYGAYGFANTDGTGGIKRMLSSYVLNTTRTGTPTPPPINATYPLGCLCEDYTYTTGAGDLDAYNGRFCITPDYPNGIYAYFVTVNNNLYPVYPFVIGNQYYGTVQNGNTGPGGGHNTIPGTASTYTCATNLKPTITGSANGCPNVAINFSVPAIAGASYNWVATGGGTITNQGTNSIIVQWTTAGIYSVLLTQTEASGCTESSSFVVTIGNSFTPVINGNLTACANDIDTFSVAAGAAGTIYNWSVSGGTILNSQPYSNSIQVQWNNGSSGMVNIVQINP